MAKLNLWLTSSNCTRGSVSSASLLLKIRFRSTLPPQSTAPILLVTCMRVLTTSTISPPPTAELASGGPQLGFGHPVGCARPSNGQGAATVQKWIRAGCAPGVASVEGSRPISVDGGTDGSAGAPGSNARLSAVADRCDEMGDVAAAVKLATTGLPPPPPAAILDSGAALGSSAAVVYVARSRPSPAPSDALPQAAKARGRESESAETWMTVFMMAPGGSGSGEASARIARPFCAPRVHLSDRRTALAEK